MYCTAHTCKYVCTQDESIPYPVLDCKVLSWIVGSSPGIINYHSREFVSCNNVIDNFRDLMMNTNHSARLKGLLSHPFTVYFS